MFQAKDVEEVKTHFLCSVTFFFFENRALCEKNVGKYCRAGHVTDDDMQHALCMLGT